MVVRTGVLSSSGRDHLVRLAVVLSVALVALVVPGCSGGSAQVPVEGAPASQPAVASLSDGVTAFEVEGVRVIHKPTPENDTVAVTIYVDGGVAEVLDPNRAGLERFAIAVATSGGPASMEKVAFASELEALGSTVGGSFHYDYATLSMSAITQTFEPTWDLFATMLRAPAFRESDVELEREQLLTNLRTELDDPDAALGVLTKELAFAGHPYAHRPQGTVETVSVASAAELRDAWDALLQKDRLTVVVVGNIERDTLEASLASGLAGLPSSEVARTPAIAPLSFDAPRVEVHERAGIPTNYVLGYFAGPPVDHPDYAALRAGLEILSDRLFEEVRTRRNLSYAVASGISSRRATTGFLYVTAFEANLTAGIMLDEVEHMIAEPVSAQDLQNQLALTMTDVYRGLQTSSAQAALLGQWELVGGGYANAEAHLDALAAVTPEDVSRVLDAWVRNIQWVVVGEPTAVDPAVFTRR